VEEEKWWEVEWAAIKCDVFFSLEAAKGGL